MKVLITLFFVILTLPAFSQENWNVIEPSIEIITEKNQVGQKISLLEVKWLQKCTQGIYYELIVDYQDYKVDTFAVTEFEGSTILEAIPDYKAEYGRVNLNKIYDLYEEKVSTPYQTDKGRLEDYLNDFNKTLREQKLPPAKVLFYENKHHPGFIFCKMKIPIEYFLEKSETPFQYRVKINMVFGKDLKKRIETKFLQY